MVWSPSFRCVVRAGGDRSWRVGHDQIDEFLEFAHGRARPATVRAYAHDLTVFFSIVEKDPVEVTSRDVLSFVNAQQRPCPGAENIVRISDGGAGLSASTIRRRLAAVSSLFGYLVACGEVAANPVPRGLPTRKSRHRDRGMVPLVRGVRRLPRILEPTEVEALMAALRTERDRAIVLAMLLGGLRAGEVRSLRLADVDVGARQVRVIGKGGRERVVPVDRAFFVELTAYLHGERPVDAPGAECFVVLRGPTRGRAMTEAGMRRCSASTGPGRVRFECARTDFAAPTAPNSPPRAWTCWCCVS